MRPHETTATATAWRDDIAAGTRARFESFVTTTTTRSAPAPGNT